MVKKIDPTPKKEAYYKCNHCGDEIFWNTQKKLTFCKCKKIAIDGCEYYVRIIGNKEDYKIIKKLKQTKVIKK
jgi:hypothetical protein